MKDFSRGALFLLAAVVGVIGGGCSGNNDPSGPSGPITVNGRVLATLVFSNFEPPVVGLTALVPGHAAVFVGADGQFAIPDVTTPYDLWIADNTSKKVMIWKGLTRADPVVRFSTATYDTTSMRGAVVYGIIYPTTAFPAQGSFCRWLITSSSGYRSGDVDVRSSPGGFVSTYDWFGPNSVQATLHVLQAYYNSDGSPYDGWRYGALRNVMIAGGATVVLRDTLASVGTDTLRVTVSLPGGASSYDMGAYLLIDGNNPLDLQRVWKTSGTTTLYVPHIGQHVWVVANARYDATGARSFRGVNVASTAKNVAIDVPNLPQLLLPVDNATSVKAGSTFSWSTPVASVTVLGMTSADGLQVEIVTAATTETLPDLSVLGLRYAAGTSFKWSVNCFGEYTSTDQGATSTAFIWRNYWAYTGVRNFTIAP